MVTKIDQVDEVGSNLVTKINVMDEVGSGLMAEAGVVDAVGSDVVPKVSVVVDEVAGDVTGCWMTDGVGRGGYVMRDARDAELDSDARGEWRDRSL